MIFIRTASPKIYTYAFQANTWPLIMLWLRVWNASACIAGDVWNVSRPNKDLLSAGYNYPFTQLLDEAAVYSYVLWTEFISHLVSAHSLPSFLFWHLNYIFSFIGLLPITGKLLPVAQTVGASWNIWATGCWCSGYECCVNMTLLCFTLWNFCGGLGCNLSWLILYCLISL